MPIVLDDARLRIAFCLLDLRIYDEFEVRRRIACLRAVDCLKWSYH